MGIRYDGRLTNEAEWMASAKSLSTDLWLFSSVTVPVTTNEAPASIFLRASSGVLMPPPMIIGSEQRRAMVLIIWSDTGVSAPLPASRYSTFIPIVSAASACARAMSGLLAGIGLVLLM